MSSVRIIAIDPGKAGSIAVREGNKIVSVQPMPATPRDLFEAILEAAENTAECVAVLERVGAMPGNGAASMFTFGQNFGQIQMALAAVGVRTLEVLPNVWQKSLGLLSRKGTSKTDHKNRLKAAAQKLFPGIKVTHTNQDALLLSEWGAKCTS